MEEFIWDGEMDCGWEDLAVKVKTESIKFTEVMLETVSYSPTTESRELISNESMKRFCLLAERLADEIENGYYYQCEDLEDNAPNACKLTSWIILGSLTETALQIFLAFYIVDYKNVHWQQWLDFPEAEVREKVNGTISKLVKDEVITGAQGKSLKNAIKETIKKHCVEHQVQKVMLDEIIQFYKEQLKEQIVWCLLHPLKIYNDKSLSMVFVGGLLWMVLSFTAYSRSDHNRMPGNEFGSAKWGEVREFNEKYAAKTADGEGDLSPENKVLSQNVRFRYDSDTLRNNNVFVVGGSGAGKTAFFLTPNLLSLHDCNIYTDPKGSLVEELGAWLSGQRDTRVYTLNLCEMEKSMHFNPFLYIRSKSDVTKLVTNLIQNTNSPNIKNSSADPFWEKAERMFLESLFLYVWMECPKGVYNQKRGRAELLQKNWKTILYLLDEAQFVDADTPPKLDLRMEELAKKKPDHPAVKAYQRYRGGPDETIRSVIMTVNARMQPFDNEELLEIFSSNDIPLDEFGVGIDGDKKTKSNLFIIIPDDDDTFNFVPGMVYTLLFQELYRQARFFGGKLPMDVGFWLDEMANIKMPNNFDKILATCRSRGVYCVPILQSLAQLKTLFADGAWEGIVGNCDTFIYLGGNEASTYEYVSKLLGKWTIDKRTSGESKGSSGSYSQNYDVLGRELMLEYELRLLPDDECIIFVRGENPIRDKKWFPWEHEQYLEARKCGLLIQKSSKKNRKNRWKSANFSAENP